MLEFSLPVTKRNYCPIFLFPFIEKLWSSIYDREVNFLSSVLIITCIKFELSVRHLSQSDSHTPYSPQFALVLVTDLHVVKFKGKFSTLSLLEGVLTELLIPSWKHFFIWVPGVPWFAFYLFFHPLLVFYDDTSCALLLLACFSLSVLTPLVSSSRIKT